MTRKQISGAVMAVAGVVTGELCVLKMWYLPQPNGDVQVSCFIGIAVSIILVVVGMDWLHDLAPKKCGDGHSCPKDGE